MKMKKNRLTGILLGLVVALGSCAQEQPTTFKFLYPKEEKRGVELEIADERKALEFQSGDSLSRAELTLKLSGGQYARLWVGDLPYTVWLEAGKPWTADFKWRGWRFTGEGAAACDYLNQSYRNPVYFIDYYRIPNRQFREKLERAMREREDSLRAASLPETFTLMETKRLRSLRDKHIASGVVYGEVTDGRMDLAEDTREELRRALEEDSSAWGIPEYREAKYLALSALAKMEGVRQPFREQALNVLRMATENYREERLVTYIVERKVMEYVKNVELGDMTEMDSIFRRWVRNPETLAAYESILDKARTLAPGQPAADFAFEDMEGKTVRLSDFRGKYVYVDLWATWCGPCNAEIPHLRKLEERLRGKNIVFVGISSDSDRDAWAKFVKERDLGGVQLFMNGDRRFMEKIHCEGIPRFLLIDREGRYVDSDMTRPSNPATLEVIEGLPGL